MSGILTLWRSHKNSGTANNDSATRPSSSGRELHSFEEVSPLTDRDKVLRWLQSVEPEATRHNGNGHRQSEPETTTARAYPDDVVVGQSVAFVAMTVAELFRKENMNAEAYEVYKYAMGIFQKNPVAENQDELLADLLLKIGMVKCSLGQLATGSQLMEESAEMLGRAADSESFKIAEVWFHMGNVFLADNLRQESLQARIMQLVREDVEEEGEGRQDDDAPVNASSDGGGSQSDPEQNDSYCVCIYEALSCYRQAMTILGPLRDDDANSSHSELVLSILSNMADCYVMTGNVDLAEVGYEESLRLFPNTYGSPLLPRNAHVVTMLGTVSFLLGNFVRAATMYETALILLQHLQTPEDPTMETAWTATMLGLSYAAIRHYDKSIVWCIKAFTMYTKFFRGRILDVDALSRWFIVQNLYVLGVAYITLDINDKALYYLNLSKNMRTSSSNEQDLHQLVKVLRAIADAYNALEERDKALRYYEEALQYSKRLGGGATTTSALQNQLLNRMAGVNVDGQQYTAAGTNLEEALDYQKDVESSIKDDMIAILLKLGVTSILACDVDKAIGCYTDCIQAYRDSRRRTEPGDVAGVMASLGTLCHVKGSSMQDDDDDEADAFMDKAERYFEEAFDLVGTTSPVCVQYANFLYQQGRFAEALTVMLPYVFCRRPADDRIAYNGIEQAVLPDHLHYDAADDEDTLVLGAPVFARFLAVLCFNELGLTEDADDALVQLYRAASVDSRKAFDYVTLGYGLMETRLFEEAAASFLVAARASSPDNRKQIFHNACICFLLSVYVTLARAVDFLLECIHRKSRKKGDFAGDRLRFKEIVSPRIRSRLPSPSRIARSDLKSLLDDDLQRSSVRTGGVESDDLRDSSVYAVASEDDGNKGLENEDEDDEEEELEEEWTTEEIVVETPRHLLEMLTNQANQSHTLSGSGLQSFEHRPPPIEGSTDQNNQQFNNPTHPQTLPTTNMSESTPRQNFERSTLQPNILNNTTQDIASTNYCIPRSNLAQPPLRSNPSQPDLPHSTPINSPSTSSLALRDENEIRNKQRTLLSNANGRFDFIDNAPFYATGNNKGRPPEVNGPEVNGNDEDVVALQDDSSDEEEWVVSEEVIETPSEILAMIRNNNYV